MEGMIQYGGTSSSFIFHSCDPLRALALWVWKMYLHIWVLLFFPYNDPLIVFLFACVSQTSVVFYDGLGFPSKRFMPTSAKCLHCYTRHHAAAATQRLFIPRSIASQASHCFP
jgi:hypothetical protein